MTTRRSWKERYLKVSEGFKEDKTICKENRELLLNFLKWEAYKLKRKNNLRKLDEGCYNTLLGYISKFKNVNKWFNNKPLKDITKEDIKRVYDGLEDGDIKRKDGKPFENLADNYYSKIFKSKLFEMVDKADLAREVIEFTSKRKKEVRFIYEKDFRKLVDNAYKPLHRLLLWLAWDYGENINALLKLKKADFYRQLSPHTKEPEYMLNLKKDILKRTRKARSEISNYNETVKLLDNYLKELKDDDRLFNFGYGGAKKILNRVVERSKVKCIPNGEKVTWKDLRSGMSCDLLKKGWTTDEVNARLGHKPSSDEIDCYVNFLAIDRHRPKKKVHEFEIQKLQEEIDGLKQREELSNRRLEKTIQVTETALSKMKNELAATSKDLDKITNILKKYIKE